MAPQSTPPAGPNAPAPPAAGPAEGAGVAAPAALPPKPVAPSRGVGRNRGRRDLFAALGFLAPNFLGFFLFVAFPIAFSLGLVFTNWSLKPAIETRFIWFDNIVTLIGFRAVDGGGSLFAFALHAGAYIAMAAGGIWALVSLGRKMSGVRLGGVLLLLAGIATVLWSIVTQSALGWALVGLTLAILSIFFIVDDDEAFHGKGVAGPVLLIAAMLLVRGSGDYFDAHWRARDPLFWTYLYNTLFLMFLIPIQIAGSLALALVLAKPFVKRMNPWQLLAAALFSGNALIGGVVLWHFASPDIGVLWAAFWTIAALGIFFGVVAFRTLFFLPSFTAGVAIMLLWKQMFNPNFGAINVSLEIMLGALNTALAMLGLPEWLPTLPRWILDPHWAKPSLILMGFWTYVGGTNMLIYLAGLSNVPEQLYEAARIDGANRWQIFRSVTWPQLAPTTFFIVIMSTIAGLQGGFEQARVMTQGGPAGATKTLSYYIWEKAFQELALGYASAIAWVMFVIIFALTALNWKFGNQYVND